MNAGFTPGGDLVLTLTAKFTRTPRIACTSTNDADFLTMTNYVSVHAGEAPLPRFRDNRWAYGDLHFHGQGTDNEGELGYGYRGVLRAMGAMGLDFVLAVEHASDSDQILDIDYNGNSLEVLNGRLVSRNGVVLRDMDAQRFAFLHGQLWGAMGANKTAAIDGRSSANAPARSQNNLGHGATPQIFLGGEVDAMPELPANFPANGSFEFGNGVGFQLSNLCGGWTDLPFSTCPQSDTVKQREGVTILQDVQGFNAMHPARVHMLYFPRDPADPNAFVSSRTGILGGGGRQLTRGDGVLSEMENNSGQQKGFTFLAHPIPGGGCGGGTPDMAGGPGPDVVPYTRMMLDQAFASKAVLGLEFWNEDIRMKNAANTGVTKEIGFHSPDDDGGHGLRNDEPKGFVTGKFEMHPWARFLEPSFAQPCTSMEWTLHHGLKQWDDMLMRGIMPTQTASLGWLPRGEPRRLFMAGGSDAHGDLNYHRAGYTLGLTQTDDMAIGKPRNLVMAGDPRNVIVAAQGVQNPAVKAFSQAQVLNAMRNGVYSVTDGPALRIAIDRNGNGVIDDGDIPMGGIVEMFGDKMLPVLVEWDSTPEWGPIQQVELVIGAISTSEPSFNATFAPSANGPRSAGAAPDTRVRPAGGGRNIVEHTDGYSTLDAGKPGIEDPTSSMLRFFPLSLSGHRKIEIPLSLLSIGDKGDNNGIVPDRLYVRAFARSQPMVGTSGECAVDPKGGKCFLRYAFSNPVWAISPSFPAGTCPQASARTIDSDGDGMPDGCDPCPHTKQPRCDVVIPPTGGIQIGPGG